MPDEPQPVAPLSPDSLRIGPYRIARELGSGGMGSVYLASVLPGAPRDGPFGDLPPSGTLVALKAFHPHLVSAGDFEGRFRREAQVGASIRHPNVVRTLDVGTDRLHGRETSYIVMEYVEGQTLRDLIAELGRLPEELTSTIAQQVCAGLVAIHAAGITHRDLKPENVIITGDHRVKLMDLGVAKVRDASIRLSLTGQFLGSVHYASPEQFRDPEGVDGRADLYAVGILIHEMLTGSNPFYHRDIPVVLRKTLNELPPRLSLQLPETSPVLDQIAASLAQKDPDERIQTANEVLDALCNGEDSAWWAAHGRADFDRSGRRVARRMPVQREAPLIGRTDELARLRKLFDRAAQGERHVLLLEGEAGVGKSRLVDEFAALLAHDGVALRFAFGSCPPQGGGRPFQAFSEALLPELGEFPEETLAGMLPEGAPAAAFAALLEGRPPVGEPLSMDAVRSLFAACVRRLSADRPLLLAIEDVHLAGEGDVNLFSYLARDARTSPVLLVATFRPPEEGQVLDQLLQGARDARFDHLVLDRLGPKDVGQLLREVLKSERLVQELGFRLLEKTEGNPYFIFEVLRSLREQRVLLPRTDGGWTMADTRIEIQVPDSVRELLRATVARLTDEDREVLDLAAVQGMEFDPDLLAELLGTPRIAMLRRLSQLERKQRLIRSAGRRCRFDHHQLQELLYAELMDGLREEYHALIGGALEKRGGTETDGARSLEIARHLLLGGRPDEALPHIEPALTHALDTYATEQGIVVATRFLEAAEAAGAGIEPAVRTTVLLALAELYDHEGRREDEREALEQAGRAVEEVEDTGLQRLAFERRLALLFQLGEFDAAQEVCRDALRVATREKDRMGAVAALGNLAGALRSQGRYDDAVNALRRALSWVLPTKSELRRCLLTTSLGLVQFHRGHQAPAQRLFLQAWEMARPFGAGDPLPVKQGPTLPADAMQVRFAGLSRALGRYAESRIDAERTLLLSSGLPRRVREAALLLALGILAGHLDQLGYARAAFTAALEACRETGDARFEAAVLHALGENAFAARDQALARRRFTEALALRRKIGYRPGVCETLLALGQLAALDGEIDVARPHLDEATELAPLLEMPGIAALARATAAMLFAREGRKERAREELEHAHDALSGASPLSVSSRAEGLYFAALTALALGDRERHDATMWQAYDVIQGIAERMQPEQRAAFLTGTFPNREIVKAVGERRD